MHPYEEFLSNMLKIASLDPSDPYLEGAALAFEMALDSYRQWQQLEPVN